MTVDAALLTVSQFRCVLWPMALDNTLMVSREGSFLWDAVPDSTHGIRVWSRSGGRAYSPIQAHVG
jgi:hypothetical protein